VDAGNVKGQTRAKHEKADNDPGDRVWNQGDQSRTDGHDPKANQDVEGKRTG
jgi:hypothetical protein